MNEDMISYFPVEKLTLLPARVSMPIVACRVSISIVVASETCTGLPSTSQGVPLVHSVMFKPSPKKA